MRSTRQSSAGSNSAVNNIEVGAGSAANDAVHESYYMPNNSISSAYHSNNDSVAAINHAPSMATLCNIGNTCYLNSVVYTLRFAPHFLHNLHHLTVDLNSIQQSIMRLKASRSLAAASNNHLENPNSWSNKDLLVSEQYNNGSSSTQNLNNTNNATNSATSLTTKSSHQLLTEKLHELYQSLHRNEMTDSTEPYHADTLLHAIQDVSSIFEGNQQQDAHEFLMCLLNSIRETCQTMLKAIAEYPDVLLNG